MHILHTHSFTVHLALTRRNWLEIRNVFRCWAVSSIFSLLWLILFSGRIYSENVNWCWSLLAVQKLFFAITTENKRTDGHFKYFNNIQNVQRKSKLPVGKTWKRLCFIKCTSVQRDTRIQWKEAFAKPRRLTVSIMFGKLCFVLVLGPLGRRFMMSLF